MYARITHITSIFKQTRYRGFYILATVAFITVVLVGGAMIERAIASNRRAVCAAHLSTLGAALLRYTEEYERFPSDVTTPEGEPLLSWRVELLQILDPKLYSQFDLTQAWNSEANISLLHRMPDWYSCPADKEAKLNGITSYYSVCSPESISSPVGSGPFRLAPPVDHLDCILLIESARLRVPWTCPGDFPGDPCNAATLNRVFASSACEHSLSPYVIRVDGQRVGLGP